MTTTSVLENLFGIRKPIIGNIHCLALPGSPAYRPGGMKEALIQALEEAEVMADCGIDGVIIENAGDIPYVRPEHIGYETVAALTAISLEISKVINIPIGIICLANAAVPSIAIAAATDASFVRVNQWAHAYVAIEGLMNGPAPEALRFRSFIHASDVKIFADVHVKFGAHMITSDRSIPELAKDVENSGADVLIATGLRTGDPTKVEEINLIKEGTSKEVIVGSGLNAQNASKLLQVADGAIVGASLKETGRWQDRLSRDRVCELMRVVRSLR